MNVIYRKLTFTCLLIAAAVTLSLLGINVFSCADSSTSLSPVLTVEYVLEYYDIDADTLESMLNDDVDIDAVIAYHDLRESITDDHNIEQFAYRINALYDDMHDPEEIIKRLTNNGKAAKKEFSADDIYRIAIYTNPEIEFFSILVDFKTSMKYGVGTYYINGDYTSEFSIRLEERNTAYYREVIDSCRIYDWKHAYRGNNGCTTGSYAWGVGIEMYDGTIYSYYGNGIFANNAPDSLDALLDSLMQQGH